MNAFLKNTVLREVSLDELRTAEGGMTSFIPGLNPVVTLAARASMAPQLSAPTRLNARSDEYVRYDG